MAARTAPGSRGCLEELAEIVCPFQDPFDSVFRRFRNKTPEDATKENFDLLIPTIDSDLQLEVNETSAFISLKEGHYLSDIFRDN
ncbi:hypothetical protein CEXT_77701 [Caerostris extrusa]|uniref:Uncharacterized protein n=1 Tax=Caerostris extrusa TaxID=172846 RepID=A0AAV4U5I7_CAEEX|nr:hypothetical protein CEXT_77701 [Caerostris extrusa]